MFSWSWRHLAPFTINSPSWWVNERVASQTIRQTDEWAETAIASVPWRLPFCFRDDRLNCKFWQEMTAVFAYYLASFWIFIYLLASAKINIQIGRWYRLIKAAKPCTIILQLLLCFQEASFRDFFDNFTPQFNFQKISCNMYILEVTNIYVKWESMNTQ